jgi:tRNA(Ile)-lysidine synthase
MLEQIDSILRDKCGVGPQATVVVGVSGGPDSMCLMDVLHASSCRVVVAHFNHQLRSEADSEAHAVEAAAARLSVPYVAESGDVRSYARAERLSIEEAARQLRYAFLFAQARRLRAEAVAVGHTADDQVETVLMHFIRGAGLDGLRGMSHRTILPIFDAHIPLVRPLLDVWRDEILSYCASHGLNPSHDVSNESLEYLRNRVRHELIPNLEAYNPRFREAAWRMARTLNADHELLQQKLAAEWDRALVCLTDGVVGLDTASLSESSRGLQVHLIRLAVRHLDPQAETTYSLLERAASFLADSTSARLQLGAGLQLIREGAIVYVSREGRSLPSDGWPQVPADRQTIRVSVGMRLSLAGGWEFEVVRPKRPHSNGIQVARNLDRFQVWLDEASLPQDLELRTWRDGDRFEPLGMRGHTQKLSDFFVNAKLPARVRRRWPLLCSGDIIVWVPGYRPAETFRVRPGTRNVICCSFSRPAETSSA